MPTAKKAAKPKAAPKQTTAPMTGGSILPAITELERLFLLAAPLFNYRDGTLLTTLGDAVSELPAPVITIQSQGRKSAFGWFHAQAWSTKDGSVSEINLSAEHLKRPAIEIAETLIHEMCHYVNFLEKLKDCSVDQYHNLKFKSRAEAVGLTVTQSDRFGWAHTALGDELRATVEGWHVDEAAFAVFKKGVTKAAKAPTKMKKWRCGCTNIRAAVVINAICCQCGSPFKLQ
jgi:hypothetical protein